MTRPRAAQLPAAVAVRSAGLSELISGERSGSPLAVAMAATPVNQTTPRTQQGISGNAAEAAVVLFSTIPNGMSVVTPFETLICTPAPPATAAMGPRQYSSAVV